MNNNGKHRCRPVELLAPAGNFEKLEIAVHYGADAVYLAGKDFSLRNFSGNFSMSEMRSAIDMCRRNRVRVYIACNIYPRNFELAAIAKYLAQIGELSPDGIIAADPGIAAAARRSIPHVPLHISTQANITSLSAARFWADQGACRINPARELSLLEIQELVNDGALDVEVFIHGAMCMAYSGRCLLSNFLTGRDSNRGMCSHPCRWRYSVVEETRPGSFMPLTEDERGTYIFHSRDLCMIDHIPDLIRSGVRALKIEGRMKSIHYLASTLKVYRAAIDRYYSDPEIGAPGTDWRRELQTTAVRGYCTGFYFGSPLENTNPATSFLPYRPIRFLGKILESTGPGTSRVQVRNRIRKDVQIEVLSVVGPIRKDRILDLRTDEGLPISTANPGATVQITTMSDLHPMDLIRRNCNTATPKPS